MPLPWPLQRPVAFAALLAGCSASISPAPDAAQPDAAVDAHPDLDTSVIEWRDLPTAVDAPDGAPAIDASITLPDDRPSRCPGRSVIDLDLVGASAAGARFELTLSPVTTLRGDEACDPNGDDLCTAGSVCTYLSFRDVYRCATTGAEGLPCRSDDPALACDPGLRCEPLYRLCRALLPRDASCDLASALCPPAQTCVLGPVTARFLRCRDDGTLGARCRPTSPRCDEGSVCTGAFCQRVFRPGEACIPDRREYTCGESASCQLDASAHVCVADGALDGRCRRADPPCDPGSSCARAERPGLVSMCRRAVAEGERCDPNLRSNACPEGHFCLGASPDTRCAAAGTEGVVCRAGPSPCERGLGCAVRMGSDSLRRCRPAREAGEPCDRGEVSDACAAGTSCLSLDGTSFVCLAVGGRGAACRPAGAACEPGLGCDRHRRCAPGRPAGASCDPRPYTEPCAEPLGCVADLTRATASCALATYVEQPAPAEPFVDACDGGRRLFQPHRSLITSRSERMALPFPFRAYGADVREVQVFTNGAVSLGPEAHRLPSSGGIDNFPWAGASVPLVAAFWDHVYPRGDGASGVCVRVVGTAPERRVVIGWRDVFHYGRPATHLTFAVVLHERDGLIDVRYDRLEADYGWEFVLNGSSGAVGIQGRAGLDATRHAAYLSAPLAIRYAPR